MEDSLLQVNNISYKYDSKQVLDNLSFEVDKNTINAVLCPNNCGKTTLIKILSGVYELKDGEIVLNGIDLDKKNFSKYVLEIGTVFEDINDQFVCEKVNDELRYPLVNLGCKESEIQERLDVVVNTFRLSLILGKDILRLSYFDKIKVLIVTSIIHSPKLLLLDDVFRFLTEKEKQKLFKLLKTACTKLGITVLFTTSNLMDTIECNKIYVINDGQIVMNDTFDNLIINDNELSKIGIEIPLMIDLSRKLEFYNLIDTIYYDPDKVVDKLWK